MEFKVLVVDDDNTLRMLHKMMLRNLSIDVELAKNGKEAIEMHEAGRIFNLILMDMDMPLMNGIEATKTLRTMGVKSPIIGVTSEVNYYDGFIDAGADHCVIKPLKLMMIKDFLPSDYAKKIASP